MGVARLLIYLVGLVFVTLAAWVFLTQTEIGQAIPPGVAFAVLLLIVGIGVMAAANSIRDARLTQRVVHEGPPGAVPERRVVRDDVAGDRVVYRDETVEERRYD